METKSCSEPFIRDDHEENMEGLGGTDHEFIP